MYPLKILFWYPRKLPEKEGDLQDWTQGGAETEQRGMALSVGITAGAAWGRSEVHSSRGAPTRCSGAQFPPSRPRRRCPLLPPTSSAPSPCPSPFLCISEKNMMNSFTLVRATEDSSVPFKGKVARENTTITELRLDLNFRSTMNNF